MWGYIPIMDFDVFRSRDYIGNYAFNLNKQQGKYLSASNRGKEGGFK